MLSISTLLLFLLCIIAIESYRTFSTLVSNNNYLLTSSKKDTQLFTTVLATDDIDVTDKVVTQSIDASKNRIISFGKHVITRYFLPSGELSPDYFKYAQWRLIQRLVSATSNVLGTQALLLALGFKRKSIGISAASTWVLKDALGKFSRIFWASKYGRKFDADAKQWRFLSSVLFSVGNALEIVTYILPNMFLIIAALANALKQMAMVTYSSTRNTIYKSFARNSDNIGDITAKGEAQIAVIDLIGMLFGILISIAIGTSKPKIIAIFSILSVLDLACIYNEIRSVVFDVLNFERTAIVLNNIYSQLSSNMNNMSNNISSLNPYDTSLQEKIFQSTKYNENIFHTCKTSKMDKTLTILYDELSIDYYESYKIYFYAKRLDNWFNYMQSHFGLHVTIPPGIHINMGKQSVIIIPEIILHSDSTSIDIFKAFINLFYCKLLISSKSYDNIEELEKIILPNIVKEGYAFEISNSNKIFDILSKSGWITSKFIYGTIRNREIW